MFSLSGGHEFESPAGQNVASTKGGRHWGQVQSAKKTFPVSLFDSRCPSLSLIRQYCTLHGCWTPAEEETEGLDFYGGLLTGLK